mgnify:CR=1 FL=1
MEHLPQEQRIEAAKGAAGIQEETNTWNGWKQLGDTELLGLAGLYGCPVSVLTCPKVIMLDTERLRHRKMIAKVDNWFIQLKCMARKGNQSAGFLL